MKRWDHFNLTGKNTTFLAFHFSYTVVLSLKFLQKKELSLGGRPPWRLEGAGWASEDLKRAGALTPLGQKHTGWIWTGNLTLVKRNALTTEPQLLILDGKIWNIAVYEVELQKKKLQHRKHVRMCCRCLPTLVLSPALEIWLGESNEMCLQGLNLSSTEESAYHHASA